MINGGMARIPAMRITFAILSVIATICMLVPAFGLNEKDYYEAQPTSSNMFSSLGKTFKNKDFRVFLGQDIIYFFGLAMFQTGLPFFVTSLLQLPEAWTTYMFGGLTLLSLAFYPFVTKMAAKWGKKKLLIAAFIGFVITFGFTALSGEKLSFIPIYVQAVIIVILGEQYVQPRLYLTMLVRVVKENHVGVWSKSHQIFYAFATVFIDSLIYIIVFQMIEQRLVTDFFIAGVMFSKDIAFCLSAVASAQHRHIEFVFQKTYKVFGMRRFTCSSKCEIADTYRRDAEAFRLQDAPIEQLMADVQANRVKP